MLAKQRLLVEAWYPDSSPPAFVAPEGDARSDEALRLPATLPCGLMPLTPAPEQPLIDMDLPPRIVIIVLNWNGFADTCECLNSLKRVTYPNHEIVVIDNGSSGDDARRLREMFGPYAKIIANPENLGFAGGCNPGIRRALDGGAEFVLLLNNDVTVDPPFLDRMVATARELPDAAALCPKIYFREPPTVICSTGGRVYPWTGSARQVGRGEEDHGQYDQVAVRDYADGACMLISKEALVRVGLLDEEYFAYWEETDWCDRARRANLRCYYVPTAHVWHRTARSQAPDSGYHYLFRRNAFLFLRKRKTPLHLLSALMVYLLVLAPIHLLRHPGAIRRLPGEASALLWHLGHPFRSRN
ncbi:MAG: glycosyltransferase family 2 protein [Dehalococcoidia bacterium]